MWKRRSGGPIRALRTIGFAACLLLAGSGPIPADDDLDRQDRVRFHEFEEIVLVVRPPPGSRLDSRAGLELIKRLHRSLLSLPGVERIRLRSLASLIDPPRGTPFYALTPVLDDLPATKEGLASLLGRLRDSVLSRNLYLCRDGDAAAIYVRKAGSEDAPRFADRVERWARKSVPSPYRIEIAGPLAASVGRQRDRRAALAVFAGLTFLTAAAVAWPRRGPGPTGVFAASLLAIAGLACGWVILDRRHETPRIPEDELRRHFFGSDPVDIVLTAPRPFYFHTARGARLLEDVSAIVEKRPEVRGSLDPLLAFRIASRAMGFPEGPVSSLPPDGLTTISEQLQLASRQIDLDQTLTFDGRVARVRIFLEDQSAAARARFTSRVLGELLPVVERSAVSMRVGGGEAGDS